MPATDVSAQLRRADRRAAVATTGGLVAVVVLVVVSAATGTVPVTLGEAARLCLGHLVPGMPWMSDGSLTPLQDQAVWQFRVPRALLAACAGAGLALAGALMQAVVRNPLAEPYVLGVSAGAGLGAVLVITLGSTAVGGLGLGAAAFVGATLTSALVASLARLHGTVAPTRMILCGVAVGSLLSALTSYLTLTTDAQNVVSVLFFLLGSVSAADLGAVGVAGLALAVALPVSLLLAGRMDALVAGDEAATALGVDVDRLRLVLMLVASLLTGAVVSVSGGIGFVGLVVPHVARILVGGRHRRLIPVAVAGGAAFLVLADLLARTAAAPTEVPLGILTAVVGAPFFLWLVRRDAASAGGVDR